MNRNQQTNADLTVLLKARNTLLWVVTREERRVERTALLPAAAKVDYLTICWDCADGFTDPSGKAIEQVNDALTALNWIGNRRERAVYILRDFHRWLDPFTLRKLRNLARDLKSEPKDRARTIIILSPSSEVPPELAGQAIVIDYPLPEREEVSRMLDEALAGVPSQIAESCTNGIREAAIDAVLGMNAEEIESCYAKSLVATRSIDTGQLSAEKRRVISRAPGLTWYDPDPRGLDAIGGLGKLKQWCVVRKLALSRKARDFGLPFPKGMLLVGVPGSGKSLAAKAVPTAWGLPLLRLDLGGMRSKFVGDSETNLRRGLEIASTVAPCVLWLDEVEKAIPTGQQGDGGVTADALGQVLQWMQEQQGVFVVATSNDVSALPPELLRKGRFDELFWVDLPTENERAEIAATTLRQYKRDPERFDLKAIARVTSAFTGSEVAQLIPDALFVAFNDGERELTTEDVTAAASEVVPLSKTAAEKIERLRAWGKANARPASVAEDTITSGGRQLDI
jgi:hypothetical protein